MHVCGNNVNDTMTRSTVRVLQEGKAASDENSLYVLGSLADLQQGTFDVTYLPFFFLLFLLWPFFSDLHLNLKLQRIELTPLMDGSSENVSCRKVISKIM